MSRLNNQKISLATVLIAMGVVHAPFLWFYVFGSKAFPGQHMVNAIAGVLLGPFWAAFIAFCIGVVRMALCIGTIFSLPGGIPGGVVVGLFAWILNRTIGKHQEIAALTEPIGTIFIGATIAVYFVAPQQGLKWSLIPIWIGWSFSTIPGAIAGFLILETLKLTGFTREIFNK